MLQFVNRMSTEQIAEFFSDVGEFIDMKQSASEGMKDVTFRNKNGIQFWYSIADEYICAYGYHKTSEDWKFYLLDLFGEEYLHLYMQKPVENSFVEKLSIVDVKSFLMLDHIIADSIREEKAFRKGTRRFKFKVLLSSSVETEKEVIIGPHLLYCEGIPSMPEILFMRFFTQKFGMDFINYYIEIEKESARKKVLAYEQRCGEQVARKMDYMVKIWEKE